MLKIDYNSYHSICQNFRQRYLILHYTAGNFASSVEELTSDVRQVSAHYLVPTTKEVDPSYTNDTIIPYSLVEENNRAWHAGVSYWSGRTNINDSSIGIEIVNMASATEFPAFPKEQIDVVISLCQNILARYPDISAPNVLGHSDIAVGRKVDPGPKFPWYTLYQAGIGAWYDKQTMYDYKAKFTQNMPSEQDVVNKLIEYGYTKDAKPEDLFKAFQMHFRNTDYSGKLDAETAAIAYALVDKYN